MGFFLYIKSKVGGTAGWGLKRSVGMSARLVENKEITGQ